MAGPPLIWHRRRLPVCASTETELARWLLAREARGQALPQAGLGFAVLARRQRFGVGQQGRVWQSPPGGLWLSAAFPWPAAAEATAPLALAAALGLAWELERLGLRPRIKWPNDLLLDGRKLAGVLPRLRWRGARIRWAQVGVGLNGVNRVPPGAMALAEALAPPDRPSRHSRHCWHPGATPRRLEPLALAALARAAAWADQPQLVMAEAEARLWRPPGGWSHAGLLWVVRGLTASGGLRLERGDRAISLQRCFAPDEAGSVGNVPSCP